MRRLFLTFLFALLAPVALAQSVNWAPGDSGDPSDLLLVFRGATPSGPGQPILPAVSGFTFTYVGSAQQTSVINGVVSQSVVLSYRLRSQAGGPVRIPAFDVQTSAGPVRVPAYSGPALPAAADLGVRSTLAAEANTFWAGEVFPLTYVVSVPRRASSQLGSDIVWNSAPLAAEAWSLPVQSDVVVNGEPRVNVTYRAQAYARTPGSVKLNAAQQVVNIATGSFGFFGAPRVEQLSVVSNQPEITIKPLPGNAPAGFNGAVGDFKLTAKVVPEKANVGDPVTWTLTLEGTGNWPEIAGLPAREVSRDFQVVQPKAKKTNAEGKLFEATLVEDVVLIPTKPGTYKIGPVSYACFDPKTGDYKTLTSDSVTVTITGSAAAPAVTLNVPANTGATSQPKGPDLGAAANPRTKLPDEPTGPSPIPGDPIAGGGNALAPLGHATFLVLISSPVALLALLWGGLALRRATQTDPLRGRRLAQKQLRATLARLPGADAATRARLLLDWQHQSIAFWGIAHAAPAAATLGEPAWKTLWEESDRALYSASAELPGDWITRAEAAVKAQRLPAFSAFSLLLPRNLLPFFFLVVLALTTAPGRLGAADATADYRAGKFAAAEKTWRAELKANPTNWAARHNLGLALAQEQKWAESAAHTTAAFVQNPSDARVSRELATSYPKAGYTVEGLSQFVQPDRWMKLAMLASPAGWQLALAGGIALLCGALALALLRAYGWRARAVPAAAIVLLIAGLILTPVAEFGRRSYGAAGDPRAMLAWGASSTLRSIPTEADNTQQTTPLAAGTIGVVDNTYLDWVHLSFRNGQAGWSKKNELLPLWK
jgi:uncharacterized protein YjeT (DUF2065 family)